MSIRKASINDIDNGLLDVYIQGYNYHKNGRPDVFSDKSKEEIKIELEQKLEQDNIIVIEDKKYICGFLIYKKNEIRKIIHVDQLVVLEDKRNQGYGKQLMKKIEYIAKSEGYKKIVLDCRFFNKNALDVYRHIGFREQRIIFEKEI